MVSSYRFAFCNPSHKNKLPPRPPMPYHLFLRRNRTPHPIQHTTPPPSSSARRAPRNRTRPPCQAAATAVPPLLDATPRCDHDAALPVGRTEVVALEEVPSDSKPASPLPPCHFRTWHDPCARDRDAAGHHAKPPPPDTMRSLCPRPRCCVAAGRTVVAGLEEVPYDSKPASLPCAASGCDTIPAPATVKLRRRWTHSKFHRFCCPWVWMSDLNVLPLKCNYSCTHRIFAFV
jgi:hypothetical protein